MKRIKKIVLAVQIFIMSIYGKVFGIGDTEIVPMYGVKFAEPEPLPKIKLQELIKSPIELLKNLIVPIILIIGVIEVIFFYKKNNGKNKKIIMIAILSILFVIFMIYGIIFLINYEII